MLRDLPELWAMLCSSIPAYIASTEHALSDCAIIGVVP